MCESTTLIPSVQEACMQVHILFVLHAILFLFNIDFDKLNPIVISRFVKIFSRYNYYSNPYKSNMVETIKQIKKNKLSTNTKEVLDAIIE